MSKRQRPIDLDHDEQKKVEENEGFIQAIEEEEHIMLLEPIRASIQSRETAALVDVPAEFQMNVQQETSNSFAENSQEEIPSSAMKIKRSAQQQQQQQGQQDEVGSSSAKKKRMNENDNTNLQDKNHNNTNESTKSTEKKTKSRKPGKKHLWAADPKRAETIKLSPFNVSCENCGALHFAEEHKQGNPPKVFSDCCGLGKLVKLTKTIAPYPKEFRALYDVDNPYHKQFMTDIRPINSAFSFASLSCKHFKLPPGPPVFKIQGHVYHRFNTIAEPLDISEATNGQLYFIEAKEAIEKRKKITNSSDALLLLIDGYLREMNVLAMSYRYMKEILEDYEQMAESRGKPVPEIKLLFSVRDRDEMGRIYNMPVQNEVFAIVVCDQDGNIPPASIAVTLKGEKTLRHLNPTNPLLEPMTYPILYPTGNMGWDFNQKDNNGKKISLCDYVRYQLSIRPITDEFFFPHHYSEKLFQQWIVDSFTRIEWDRLQFIRTHQKQLARTDAGKVSDFLIGGGIGELPRKIIILPSSFSNSPRCMENNFVDAMCIMSKTGKPDFFVTYTCNPNDEDIKAAMAKGQTASNRPDIVARVFHLKKEIIMKCIFDEECFGRAVSHVWTIEYQMRGLPHVHMLITLHKDFKLHTSEQVDKFISAEIPDPKDNEELYNLVTKHMIHGPCKPGSRCWDRKKQKCSKRFPKPFMEETRLTEDGYPLYKRRENGRYVWKNGQQLTNQYVVPYNPYLLLCVRAHINVEKVSDISSIKYIYKYVYKGFSKTIVECVMSNGNVQTMIKHDEVNDYLEARCVSSCEAAWRIFKFPIQGKSHSVMALHVHLEGQQPLYLDPDNMTDEQMQEKLGRYSHLTAYFKYMTENPEMEYLFAEMPEHCTWHPKEMIWADRKSQFKSFGRLFPVSFYERERYYLYILLLNVPGRSYDDLKTVNSVYYETFAEAAMARGLCLDDNEWFLCMQEASIFKFPFALRQLFTNILIHCGPKCPENGKILRERRYSEMHKYAILSPLNTIVDLYNDMIMDKFPGEYRTYSSIDDHEDKKTKLPVTIDILNASKCTGMPEHRLRLKINSVVMLMRNLNVRDGLCNGTRLLVKACTNNIIKCEIISGDRKGETVFIPRITLIDNTHFPYILRRHQFPLKVAFAFTINKSQSQTFESIGIDFTEPSFNHGQTYVALSRARSWDGIKILLGANAKCDPITGQLLVKNIVWKKVLV